MVDNAGMKAYGTSWLKRTIDVAVAAIGLAILSPLVPDSGGGNLCIKIWVWPPLFGQTRPGLNGRLFRLYKFRSMTEARDANGAFLPDDVRLTPFGQLLRRTSLDEIPELINVLKGDMSLVGPRPLLPEYLPHYSAEQRRRHDVRPGMTGWSQINGRNELTWEEKFALDTCWYARSRVASGSISASCYAPSGRCCTAQASTRRGMPPCRASITSWPNAGMPSSPSSGGLARPSLHSICRHDHARRASRPVGEQPRAARASADEADGQNLGPTGMRWPF